MIQRFGSRTLARNMRMMTGATTGGNTEDMPSQEKNKGNFA